MNSEFVKENIKPLRAGRNAAQLEVASQAQVDEELQNALHQQRLEYYNQITNYQGDDPLSIWYEFISWLEQSYPKSGREGNLATVLEECIRTFEKDQRYSNDGRFCKIWIKFIDMQSNALELFQILYAKRICVGCADFYLAWALHHELAADYRSAHNVFAAARREMAQPYQEIDAAYNAMIVNAGQQAIGIVNQVHMDEQRHAMTQLSTYKPGVVGSIRVPSSSSAPILPNLGENSHSNNHRTITIAHDGDNLSQPVAFSTLDAGAASVLTLVARNATNENIKTVGKWNVPGQSRRRQPQTHKPCEFQVHEDIIVPEQRGIQLPENFPEYTEENLAELELPLCFPDPPDEKIIPMYPKHSVYEIPNVEFSLEEILSRRYKIEVKLRLPRNFVHESVEQFDDWYRPLYDIEPENPNQIPMYPKERVYQFCDEEFSMEEIRARQYFIRSDAQEEDEEEEETPLFLAEPFDPNVIPMYPKRLVYEVPNVEFSLEEIMSRKWAVPQPQPTLMEQDQSNHSIDMQVVYNGNSNLSSSSKCGIMESPRKNNAQSVSGTSFSNSFKVYQSPMTIPIQVPNNTSQTVTPMEVPTPSPTTSNLIFRGDDVWVKTPTSNNVAEAAPEVATLDDIFSITPVNNVITVPKVSAKRKPRKQPLSVREQLIEVEDSDDDVEYVPFSSPREPVAAPPPRIPFQVHDDATMTSPAKPDIRHRTPAAFDHMAQRGPRLMQQRGISMKTPLRDRLLTDEDLAETGSRGGLDQADVEQQASDRTVTDLMDSSDTFFFNVNNTSTPVRKITQREFEYKGRIATNLSTIKEVSREYPVPRRVESIGSMSVLGESKYEQNLAANSQANAELRSSLLNLIGYQAEEGSVMVEQTITPILEEHEPIVIDTVAEPLRHVPSDPFKAVIITNLLNLVKFPGVHAETYIPILSTPRIMVRKDLCHVGKDRYLVEKCLGKGTFGSVFKAIGQQDNLVVALKFQKPANKWEYYICKEIQMRLGTDPIRQQFMEVFHGYFSDQASVLVSEYNPCGSLLDVANTYKQKSGKKVMPECLVMYFCIEMLKLVHTLHQLKIIHADIKPDNFLVMLINDQVTLQLIDFGCSIDMTLFPEGALFTRPITTENFICCEMRDGRPWSYHTDMFCVAASAHALLFDKYIELLNRNSVWSLRERFARYLKVDLWNKFFYATLNQLNGPANAEDLLILFRDSLNSTDATTRNDSMRTLKNIILKR